MSDLQPPDGLECWLKAGETCGGHCMAYEEGSEQDPNLSACQLLNVARKVSMNLTTIASIKFKEFKRDDG